MISGSLAKAKKLNKKLLGFAKNQLRWLGRNGEGKVKAEARQVHKLADDAFNAQQTGASRIRLGKDKQKGGPN